MSERLKVEAHDHLRCRPEHLQRRWDVLCAEYLPVTDGDSIWRYSRTSSQGDLDQGWKLHVSATILNAPRILERVAPFLVKAAVQFKAARSLDDVLRLNSGLLHTYTQVGKIITVYPRDDAEAVYLAQRLHQLTYRFKAPSVPFDFRLAHNSNVYYRYGAFTNIEFEQANGERTLGIMTPAGELVLDVRENPKPDWAHNPFEPASPARKPQTKKSVSASFRVVRALVQRGKGGVYQAIDMHSTPPRLCLLKEGRRHGELNWDGRDGAWRVRNEKRVLSRLSRCGIRVPKVYSQFELEGNFYLVMEFVDGESLHSFLLKQKRRLPINRILLLAKEVATFLTQMHRAGWGWRDCKPTNLIVNNNGTLVPIDFEGAEHINRPDPFLWGTPGFVPLVSRQPAARSGKTDDLYSLGSILYLMITGRMFDDAQPIPIGKLRRNVPLELIHLVESLLAADPQARPSAQLAHAQLTSILRKCRQEPLSLPDAKAA